LGEGGSVVDSWFFLAQKKRAQNKGKLAFAITPKSHFLPTFLLQVSDEKEK
jgi:hypothetical protein